MSAAIFDLPLDLGRKQSMFDFNNDYKRSSVVNHETSMFWQVPDNQRFLTSLTLNPMDNLCAVASGAKENNLFIYEFDPLASNPTLTHHQTISLPFIHSMKWVPSTTAIGSNGNILVSGHKNGLVHMTMLPDTYSSDTPAEILTRYNHLYHIGNSTASARIKQLELVMDGGSLNFIGSICADYVFLWDPTRFDTPRLKLKSRGLNCFDMREGYIAALGGVKGISIADFRSPKSTLSPPTSNNDAVTRVKWSPHNENLVAAVDDKHVVKVWDIRYTKPFCAYESHIDTVTGVEWGSEIRSQLVSSSHDGTIRVWDMNDHTESIKSVSSPHPQKWAQSDSWARFQDRNSSSIDLALQEYSQADKKPAISQSNRQFIGLELVDHHGAYTIDSTGCFGYHRINSGAPSSPITTASDSCDSDFNPPSPL